MQWCPLGSESGTVKASLDSQPGVLATLPEALRNDALRNDAPSAFTPVP
jgi:hypothetical protein